MRGPPSERQNSGAKALCLAFSGGGREVYCGESILGSDFHLLFTCWVLFMLPAVSQSGAYPGQVCVGLLDGAWVPSHLPMGRGLAGGTD